MKHAILLFHCTIRPIEHRRHAKPTIPVIVSLYRYRAGLVGFYHFNITVLYASEAYFFIRLPK